MHENKNKLFSLLHFSQRRPRVETKEYAIQPNKTSQHIVDGGICSLVEWKSAPATECNNKPNVSNPVLFIRPACKSLWLSFSSKFRIQSPKRAPSSSSTKTRMWAADLEAALVRLELNEDAITEVDRGKDGGWSGHLVDGYSWGTLSFLN